MNGGPWQPTHGRRKRFTYIFHPRAFGDTIASIEVRATDARGHVGRSATTYVRLGNAQPEEVVVEPQDRAMWIWEDASYNLILNPGLAGAAGHRGF